MINKIIIVLWVVAITVIIVGLIVEYNNLK